MSSEVVAAVLLAVLLSIPPTVAAYFAYKAVSALKTLSGDPIGRVAERTHDLAATNHAQLVQHGEMLREQADKK